jgi:hypothetical protein
LLPRATIVPSWVETAFVPGWAKSRVLSSLSSA